MAFKEIIGQGKAINILLGTIKRNRIPSAYLFSGESGIGKKLTAINLAKTLNCMKAVTSNELEVTSKNQRQNSELNSSLIDCCDECASCKKIDNQAHPDFLMVSPEKGEIRVDEIRAIEEALSFSPYEGIRKVVIVDDADMMNASAANAFLKTLEEPPAQSIIILVSASPDRLPETIRSRCARINFSPLSPEKCEEVIKKSISGQQSEAGGQLATLSRLSMGRPGLAIANDLIEDRDWFIRLFKDMLSGSAKEGWADKEEIGKWFDSVSAMMRDIAVLKITGRGDRLINTDLKDSIAKLSKTLEIKDIIECYVRISFLKAHLGFNLNKAITWNYTGFILKEFEKGI